MTDIVRVLESDFQEVKNDKKTSQRGFKIKYAWNKELRRPETDTTQMPLSFKYPPVPPDNHSMALLLLLLLLLIRLVHLERKSLKDPKYKEDYVKFMNEVVSRGDAEEAPVLAQEEGDKWYIPHHGVYHPKKNKIRVVFDCSARFKRNFFE